MYGYSEFVPLNEEEILKRVSQEEIIEMAIGYKPVLYQRICSPLPHRLHDKNPGSWFEFYGGKLWFLDFGDNPTHRITFKFIADFYNIAFYDALKLINQNFDLGLGEDDILKVPKPVLYHSSADHCNHEKQKSNIIYKPRPLVIKDKNYWWNRYKITKQQLIDDDVMPILWYKLFSPKQNKWIVNRPFDICYAYTEFKPNIKVYRPFADKKFKWIMNCSENDVGNLKNLPEMGRTLIIKKSYKDCRVIRNQGLNSIWFQNEGCIPCDEILIDLSNRFDIIYVWFDNDDSGIRAVIKVVEKINSLCPGKALPMWLPETLLQNHIKDPSDLLYKKSEQELKNFLVEKDLYGNNPINNSYKLDTPPNPPF